MNENGWSIEIEAVVKDMATTCSKYRILHNDITIKSSNHHNRLTMCGIVISPLAGLLSMITTSEYSDIFHNMSISLSMITGILMSIIRFGKYEDVIATNKQLAVSYASIELDIKQQFSLDRSERVPGKLYIEIITDKLHELFVRSPLIPDDFPNPSRETEDIKPSTITTIRSMDRRMIYELTRLDNNI